MTLASIMGQARSFFRNAYGRIFLAAKMRRLKHQFKILSIQLKDTSMNTTNTNTTISAIITTLASIAAYFGFNAPPEVISAIITVGTGVTMLLAHKSVQNVLTYCGAAILVVLTYV